MRGDNESCVKQHRTDCDAERAARGPETGKAAPCRRRRDAGDDQPVSDRMAPEGAQRHDDDGQRPERIREDREQPGREEGEVVLRGRDSVRGEGAARRRPARSSEPAPSSGAVSRAPAA